MSKTIFAIVLVVAAIAIPFVAPALAAAAFGTATALGIAAVTAGLEIGLTLLSSAVLTTATPRGLSTNPISRLYASLDTTTPRKIVTGVTAAPTDVRYQSYTGANQEYYEQVMALASHPLNSIDEIWIDNEKAWTVGGGVQGRYVGYLAVGSHTQAATGTGLTVDSTWTSASSMTGCAVLHMQYKLTGPDQTTPSPFQGGVSNRLTVRVKGAGLYDPRADSTVAGGSGTMRTSDQPSWVTGWTVDRARNPALQLLFYLLGWQINGKLAVGMGIPASRIDLPSFITAANHCDETVSLKAGGTEPRYRSDGVLSEGDDRKAVIDALCATMNATLRDAGGRISVQVLTNDLSTPVLALGAGDILGSEEWVQTPPLSQYYNVIRGSFVDPSDSALYQLSAYPEQSITSPDGIDRIEPIDQALVQSQTQAQRLAKLKLMRAQFQGRYTATFGPRAWGCSIGDPVTLTHPGLNWTAKIFRVVEQKIGRNGQVVMTLLEEDASIYTWTPSTDEKTGITGGTPTVYNPANNPVLGQVSQTTQLIQQSSVTGLTFSIDTNGDITISSHTRVYPDKSVSVAGATVTHAASAAGGDIEEVYYDDPTRAGGTVTYQVLRLAGGTGDDSSAYPSPTNPYRHWVLAGHVPATGTTGGGSSVGSGGGTAGGGYRTSIP